MKSFFEFAELFPWFGFFIGICLGSFLNVVTYRVPRDLSVITPGSSCPNCSAPIPWFLNLPVVGWFLLKGRAHCCNVWISPRYFVVELIFGLLFAWIFYSFGLHKDWGILLSSCVFVWLLSGVIMIDFETMFIPDRFSIGGAVLGFLLSLFFPSMHQVGYHPAGLESFLAGFQSFIGILIGSGFLYWIGAMAGKILGREALGEGDVKLLGCVGAFCGWEGAIFCIFGGAFLGCLLLVPILIWQKISAAVEADEKRLAWGMEIPFGPYLALAALGYFFGLRIWVDPWFEWTEKFIY